MKHTLTLAALTLAMLTAGTANAQAVRTEKNMSLELANQIATQSVSACAANGYAVTATVVDRAGGVRAVQRADNAGPHVAASRERPSPRHRPRRQRLPSWKTQKNAGAANLKDIPGFLLLGGGVP
jgi:hypothetical protein